MGRGIGITELLQEQGTWLLLVLFAVITQLGDVWFLFLVGSVLYVTGDELPRWGIDRRRGLFVLTLVLTYIALIGVLKNIFTLPRPPSAAEPPPLRWIPIAFSGIFTSITTADSFGFPSGHALGTTMVWGGLALVIDRSTLRRRASIAGVVVVLVSMARLVLGVHYVVDVIVGALLGIAVLGGLYWLANHGTAPDRVLLVTIAIGIVGLLIRTTFDSVAAVGSAIGGWLVWRGIADTTPAHPTDRLEVFAGFGLVGIAAGIFGVIYAGDVSYLVTFFGSATAVGIAVAAPLLGEQLV